MDETSDEHEPLNFKQCWSLLCENYFNLESVKRRFPIIRWLPGYQLDEFKGDLVAGLSVAMILIPQALGFALVANLPIERGLYSSIFGSFVYAIFGSCKDLNYGPSATTAILTASYVLIGGPNYGSLLAFSTGILQITTGLLNLDFLAEIISYPVLSSFISSACFTIILSRFLGFFGIPKIQGRKPIAGLLFYDLFANLEHLKVWDTVLGCLSLLLILSLKKTEEYATTWKSEEIATTDEEQPEYNQENRPIIERSSAFYAKYRLKILFTWLSLSRNLVTIIVSAVIAYCFQKSNIFTLTEDATPGLPNFEAADFTPNVTVKENGMIIHHILTVSEVLNQLTPGWFLIPFVASIMTIRCPKAVFCTSVNPIPSPLQENKIKVSDFDPSQEILTLGIANFLGSFIGSFPIGFTVSRAMVARTSGAKTQLNTLITCIIVIIALLPWISPAMHYIPTTTLSVVVICEIWSVINAKEVVQLYRTSIADLYLYTFTFIFVLILGVEIGFLIAFVINICVLLAKVSRPEIESKIENITIEVNEETFGFPYIIVKPTQSLHFPSIDYFTRNVINSFPELLTIIDENGKIVYELNHNQTKLVVVIDGVHIFHLDSSFVKCVIDFILTLNARGIKVVFHRFRSPIRKVLHLTMAEKELVFSHSKSEEELSRSINAAFGMPYSLSDEYSTFIQTNI